MNSLDRFSAAIDVADETPFDASPEELHDAHHLRELSTRLISEGDVQTLFQHVLDTAMALTQADMASLQMFHPERGEFRLIAWKGNTTSPASFLECVRAESNGPCAVAMRSGSRVVIPDVDAHDFTTNGPEIEAFRAAGIRAMQATPLISRTGQSLGVISTHWREAMPPHERALRLFDALARQTADLIERAQSEMRLRETARQKDALYELADRLHRTRSLDEIYDAALKAIMAALHCNRASVLLFDGAGAMRFVASGGLSHRYRDAVEGHSVWKPSDSHPAPIHIDDVDASAMAESLRTSIKAEGIGALAFIPLVSDGQLIGKFMAYFDAPHPFSQDELDLCLLIARQIAFAVERTRAEDRLRASERHFRDMIDALPAAIYMADAAGRVMHFNRAAVEFAGRTPQLGVDQWCICWKKYDANGALIAPENLPMARAFRGEAIVRGAEFIAERPDGERRWVVPYPTLLRDASGRAIGGVNMLVDITERKLAEEALLEADRRKDEFLAMLSHELRNPLAAIAFSVQVLQQDASQDPIQQEARTIIARQASSLTRLVDDLLEVSRITSGRIQLQMQRISLREIVEHAIKSAQSMINMHRHALEVSLPDQSIWLRGDPARLEQVLINLLHNAAKYTDNEGHIQLRAEVDGAQAVIRVIDDGIGIEPELVPRIFDLFTQAKRSLDRSQGGLGIGLSLVYRLVEMHGGTVSAQSVVGQGSEFVVKLPILETDSTAVRDRVADAAYGGTALRVLIVDDNLDAARGLSLLLQRAGHTVTLAGDGQAALASVAVRLPDIVFLDIGLPAIDGYEVARRLRQQYPRKELALVALTGYGQTTDRERAEQAGFDLHLVKPADISVVMQYLAEIAAARTRRERAN